MANTKWALEPSHSEVTFKVRHMMISNVSGQFKKFDSTVETDGNDIATAKVRFTADVDSISTNNDQRDGHLKSPDFFDAATHPQIVFESTSLQPVGGDAYKLHGNLTMRGTTRPVTFDVEHGGILNDGWGNVRAGFTITGKVNRKDYGLNWSALTETGGLVVGDDVKFEAHTEFVRPAQG
ncbi:YceI family protein [Nemorincola caseinilytica]|uniref:YceI family protein n=1 Tax=Nemorincola caseinilytica TaxID=2054315 RepID=A0ABP8NB26_9BACT